MFTDKQISIRDYGWRHCFLGRTKCGSKAPENFLKIPARPEMHHSAVKLLCAISLAAGMKSDRPTRRETVMFCEVAGAEKLAKVARIQGYWRDLFRHGYVRQYRRTYANGKHFDVVYELTADGSEFLARANANTNIA